MKEEDLYNGIENVAYREVKRFTIFLTSKYRSRYENPIGRIARLCDIRNTEKALFFFLSFLCEEDQRELANLVSPAVNTFIANKLKSAKLRDKYNYFL